MFCKKKTISNDQNKLRSRQREKISAIAKFFGVILLFSLQATFATETSQAKLKLPKSCKSSYQTLCKNNKKAFTCLAKNIKKIKSKSCKTAIITIYKKQKLAKQKINKQKGVASNLTLKNSSTNNFEKSKIHSTNKKNKATKLATPSKNEGGSAGNAVLAVLMSVGGIAFLIGAFLFSIIWYGPLFWSLGLPIKQTLFFPYAYYKWLAIACPDARNINLAITLFNCIFLIPLALLLGSQLTTLISLAVTFYIVKNFIEVAPKHGGGVMLGICMAILPPAAGIYLIFSRSRPAARSEEKREFTTNDRFAQHNFTDEIEPSIRKAN